jgi:excisionase family DNA binding protein
MEKLLTLAEVAERLNTTPRHVRRLVFERRIAYRKLGRYVRFHPDDVAEYVAAHRVEIARSAERPRAAEGR